jgi:hypothetical protein
MTLRGKFLALLRTSVFLAAVFTAFAVIGSQPAMAAGNPDMSFEGKITTSAGVNVPDGSYNMEFKIYTGCTNNTGTGCTNVWTEDWLIGASNPVTFSSGTFQVNLGSICAFSGGTCQGNTNTAIPWDTSPLYMSMQIGNTTNGGTCTAPIGASFGTDCGGDGVMSPYILLTSSPYAQDAGELGGITAAEFGQLSATQTWTAANTFQPTTNVVGEKIIQSSVASPSSDIFDVQSQNNTNLIQVTGPSANTAAVAISSLGSGSTISLNSAGALSFTGAASSVWDLGAAHTLSLQTVNNGPVTTGTGLLTDGGNLAINGTGITAAAGLSIATTGANALNLDSGGAANIVLGSTNAPVILVGTANNASTTQHLLQLNSDSTFTEANACTTSNGGSQGSIYYNTTTNDIRACVNSNWEDLVSTSGLGIILFGVVPDSANAGMPGDLGGISANTNSPCKVVWGSATSVTVEPCTAYSGGRKVLVASTTITLTTSTLPANDYANICLTGTNGQPALLAANTADTTATQPTFSANNPVLCLATIHGTVAGDESVIYDTRTFTNTQKTFTTTDTASSDGMMMYDSAANEVAPVNATPKTNIAGVAVSYSGTISTNSINMIIATAGPQWVKSLTTSTTVDDYVEGGGGTTAGYAFGTATAPAGAYESLGINQTVYNAATCTAVANCQGSIFVNPIDIGYE